MEIKTEDYIVKYDESQKVKDAVFKRVIDYFLKHECFSGEQIQQCDNPYMDAPQVLSDIADDIIKFDAEWL